MAEPVGCWPGSDLVTTSQLGEGAAAALGEGHALLLRANGGLAVGPDVSSAMATAWCLEDRCQVALAAGPGAPQLSDEELRERSRWYGAELKRISAWLVAVHGDGPTVEAFRTG
jgi:ribulose-5-phosphate 4-epimerase/fuculose-1-phosphate aldolase